MKALTDATIASLNESLDSLHIAISILEQITMDSPDRESRSKARVSMVILNSVAQELESLGTVYEQLP